MERNDEYSVGRIGIGPSHARDQVRGWCQEYQLGRPRKRSAVEWAKKVRIKKKEGIRGGRIERKGEVVCAGGRARRAKDVVPEHSRVINS